MTLRCAVMTWALVLLALALGMLAGGCTNSVYFYETDKFSFTAEGRPDAAGPVSANLGLKQRVVLAVPPGEKMRYYKEGPDGEMQPTDTEQSHRDAVSVISYFDFSKRPTQGGWLNDTFEIETAFITGQAAYELDEDEAANAAVAITNAGRSATDAAIVRLVWSGLKDRGAPAEGKPDLKARRLAAELDRLANELPTTRGFNLYDEGNPAKSVNRVAKVGDQVARSDYADFNTYLTGLRFSATKLKADPTKIGTRPDDRSPWTYADVTPEQKLGLTGDLVETEKEIKRLEQIINDSGIVREAIAYYASLFKE